MTKEEIFDVLKEKLVDVLPELDKDSIQMTDSMKQLGANSMDRFDVLADTMDEIGIKMPLVKFGTLKCIGEIVEVMYENQ